MSSRRRFLAVGGAGLLASLAGCLARTRGAVGAGLPEEELSPDAATEPYQFTEDHNIHPVAAYELGDADHGRHEIVVVNLAGEPVDTGLVLRSGFTDRVVYECELELDPGGYAAWRLTRRERYDIRIAAGDDALEDEVDPERIDCNWSEQVYAVRDEGVRHEYDTTEQVQCAPWWVPERV